MIKQVITLFLLTFTLVSYACSCKNYIGMADHISNSEIILSGTVTSAQNCQLETEDNKNIKNVQSYRFTILNAFKGINGKSIDIITGRGFGDCGDHFTIGKEYLIFAYDNGYTKKNDGLYETSICNWNGLVIEKEGVYRNVNKNEI
ncbi:MAG: hypothetical protein ABJM36_02070 [Algibacter sp.]|uniref:hypothetical protein n=1 Tax=Algibacter sp. TaxID=1872428 RepID=UPI003297EDE8